MSERFTQLELDKLPHALVKFLVDCDMQLDVMHWRGITMQIGTDQDFGFELQIKPGQRIRGRRISKVD